MRKSVYALYTNLFTFEIGNGSDIFWTNDYVSLYQNSQLPILILNLRPRNYEK